MNVNAVPEGITRPDVIVWGEGSTFAQQIAAGPHRLTGDEPESVGGSDTGPVPRQNSIRAESHVSSPLQRSREGVQSKPWLLQGTKISSSGDSEGRAARNKDGGIPPCATGENIALDYAARS